VSISPRRLVTSELLKVSTTRAARWVLISAGLLVVLAISGAVASGSIPEPLGTDAGLRIVLEHGGLPAILPLILGILMTAGEYRDGTVAETFLTEPRRTRVLLAKVTSGTVVGLMSGVSCAVLAVGTSSGAVRGATSYLPDEQLLTFTPEEDFVPGEEITVTLDLSKLRGETGRTGSGRFTTTFKVAP